jgi:hypothetical protein
MPKGRRARTIEADLTQDKLRQILLHCDCRLKALFLFFLSSGIHVGEAERESQLVTKKRPEAFFSRLGIAPTVNTQDTNSLLRAK